MMLLGVCCTNYSGGERRSNGQENNLDEGAGAESAER